MTIKSLLPSISRYGMSRWSMALLLAAASSSSAVAQSDLFPASRPIPADHPLRKQITEIERSVSSVKRIPQAAISPDGAQVAYTATTSTHGSQQLFLSSIAAPAVPHPVLLSSSDDGCVKSEPAWSQDGKQLAFLSDCAIATAGGADTATPSNSPGQMQLFLLDVARSNATARQITRLTGHLAEPKWSPDGSTIAFLFVDHATRAPTPMAAGDAQTGVIDDLQQLESQRIALVKVSNSEMRLLTPAALNIFEFDWSPDSRALVYTAAPPPGDDNWYIAELYTHKLADAAGHSIYKPELQIALPRWSPDGKQIAFITGLMSDEGATGGEIYSLPASGGKPRNLTPQRQSSPAWFEWTSPETILFTEFKGGSTAICTLNLRDRKTATLWEQGEAIHAVPDEASLSLSRSAPATVALVRQSWTMAPEVYAGPVGKWTQVTHLNDRANQAEAGASKVEDISWQNDSFHVQGWLLFPQPYDPQKTYPMLVSVHGGPAWIRTPTFASGDFNIPSFAHLGYFIFFPNPRGSFGQGERFTMANRRDWGFGDVRDIVSGVDAVAAKYPIDTKRVGIIGWSYGGSTAMIACGQTNRFRAAVAGAGASNLQSYYGQNQIDKWMLPYFGASVYDDPSAYMRSSALSYVKQVKTPTLLLVGERDEEAPPLQSFEYWHALKELHVPTQLVVYAGEGHGFHKYEDRIDLIERAAEWFARYMPAANVSASK